VCTRKLGKLGNMHLKTWQCAHGNLAMCMCQLATWKVGQCVLAKLQNLVMCTWKLGNVSIIGEVGQYGIKNEVILGMS
jgi:hypothetical protein